MQLIIAGIVGGLVVLVGMKLAGKRPLLKSLFKVFYVVKDYTLSSSAEWIERMRDIAAESKSEYDREKLEEKQAGKE